jgi:hypothetical protein
MAVFKSTFTAPIGKKYRLDVVKEDRNDSVIFSINRTGRTFFRNRISFELKLSWAMRLAHWLAGIREAEPSGEDQP